MNRDSHIIQHWCYRTGLARKWMGVDDFGGCIEVDRILLQISSFRCFNSKNFIWGL